MDTFKWGEMEYYFKKAYRNNMPFMEFDLTNKKRLATQDLIRRWYDDQNFIHHTSQYAIAYCMWSWQGAGELNVHDLDVASGKAAKLGR